MGVLGDPMGWWGWANILEPNSGFGLRLWEPLKTILIGWPNTCPVCLGIQKIGNGQQQQGRWI